MTNAKVDYFQPEEYIKTYICGPCSKCGEITTKENSVRLILDLYYQKILWASDKHLHPTGSCEGSPSTLNQPKLTDLIELVKTVLTD